MFKKATIPGTHGIFYVTNKGQLRERRMFHSNQIFVYFFSKCFVILLRIIHLAKELLFSEKTGCMVVKQGIANGTSQTVGVPGPETTKNSKLEIQLLIF